MLATAGKLAMCPNIGMLLMQPTLSPEKKVPRLCSKVCHCPGCDKLPTCQVNPNLVSVKNNYLTPAVNLTTYTKLKQGLHDWQPRYEDQELPGFQTALCGLVAGAAGPMSNAPIDTLSAFSEAIHSVLTPSPRPKHPQTFF